MDKNGGFEAVVVLNDFMELVSFLLVSLGRSETLEFVTGRIRQPKALLGQEVDVFGLFFELR